MDNFTRFNGRFFRVILIAAIAVCTSIVNAQNEAPVVVSALPDLVLNEYFESDTIDLTGVFSDPDAGDELTLSVASSDPAVISALIQGDSLIITEAGLGSSTVTVTATDNGTPQQSVSDAFTVTVNDANGPPVVVSALPDLVLNEYFESDTIDLTGVFSDPDAVDVLTLSVTSSDPAVISALIQGDSLIITEVGLGSSTVTVTATDNGTPQQSVSDAFTVTVNDANGPPVVVSALPDLVLNEYFESDTIDLTGVFSDPDAVDVLTLSVTSSDPAVISALIQGDSLIITEVGLGSSTVTVTATDNGTPQQSVSDAFTVTVNDANGPPVVVSALPDLVLNEYFESDTIDLTGVFSDPDAVDVLTLSVTSSDPAVISALIQGDSLIITEVGLGSSTVTVTATDNGTPQQSVSDVFTVTVNDANGPPVVDSPLPDLDLNEYFATETVDLTGVFSDPDAVDVLTLSVTSSDPAVVTVGIEGSTLTITEAGLGSSTVTVTATDNGTPQQSVSDAFIVTVNDANGPPVVDSPLPDLDLNEYFATETVDLTGVFSDPDAVDVLTLSVTSSDPAVVTVGIEGSTLTITEVGLGSSTVTVTATDNGTPQQSVSDAFTVTVNDANGPPVVDSPLPDLDLNEYFATETVDLTGVFSDPDAVDVLTLSVTSSDPAVVTVGIEGSTLTITEVGLGSSTVTVTATDNGTPQQSVSDAFTVTVNDANGPPVVDSPLPDLDLNEYFATETVDLTGVFSDPDAVDVLTLSVTSSDPAVVTVGIEGSTLTITEVGLGSSTVTVTATDNGTPQQSVSDAFTVTVNDANGPPVVDSPLPDLDLNEYFATETVDLTGVFSDPDAVDVLTLSVTSSDPAVVTVGIEGSTLTITEAGLGSSTVTVTATDNGTPQQSVSDAFTVTVNDANGPPVVDSPLPDLDLNEYFATETVDLTGVFSDPDAVDVLTLSVTSSDPAVVTVGIEGSTLTITEVGLGSSTVTVTATDNGTPQQSVSDAFTVTVNDANGPPVVDSPLPDLDLNEYFATETVDLTGVFSDPDAVDVLTLSVTSSDPAVVTVGIEGSTLTITEVGLGSSTVTVTATDNGTPQQSVSDAFTVTVNDANGPPVVDSPLPDLDLNEYFATETVDLTGVFSDPDAVDVLTLSVTSSDPAVVTVGIEGSTLTITEAGLGSSTVTVTATDNGTPQQSVSDAFTVTVNDANGPPVVDSPLPDLDLNEYFATETVDLTGVFSDPDAVDVLTLSVTSSDPAVVTVGIEGSTLTITEVGLGSSTVTVTATDNGTPQQSVSDAFTVTVYNVNDAPEVVNPLPDLELNEYFGSDNIDLTDVFTDKDADNLTLSVFSSSASVVTVTLSGSTLTINEVGLGTSTITVTATDDGTPALSTDETFLVTVLNVNDPPVVSNPIADRAYNERFGTASVSLAAVFSDPDGNDLDLSAVSGNTDVVTVIVTGTTLTMTERGIGSSDITVTASDGEYSVNEIFTVTVNNENDPPEVQNSIADRILNEYFNQITIDLSPVFSDPDAGDLLTYLVASNDLTIISVSVTGTILTLTEVGLGTTNITVTATDAGGLSVSDQFTVTVNNVNDPPVVDNPLPDVVQDEHFGTFDVDLISVFSDKDGDPLELSAFSSNTEVVNVSLEGTTLTITETGLGSSVVTVTASDESLSVDEQFEVRVNNVNDPPEVNNPIGDQVLNEYFVTLTISLAGVFNDPDGDALLLTAVSSDPSVVTVSVSGTNLIITERGLGTADITVTANDGELSVSDQLNVLVNNVNDEPVVVSPISSISRNEGFGSVNIDLGPVFIDPDGDAMTYSALSSNSNVVTVGISGTTLTITEAGLGLSTITVTASDGLLTTDDQFTFSINNINDAPEVVQPISDRAYDEGFGSETINLSTWFSDPDGDVLTFTAISSNTDAVTVFISGSILTISEVGLGTSDITVTATDNGDGNLSVSDEFTVKVLNVNDAPQLENPVVNQVVAEYFGTLDIDLSATFSDPDDNELTITAISSNTGVVTVGIVGSVLRITEQGIGLSVITLTASDGELSVSDQFNVTVNNVNDAPAVVSSLPDRVYNEGFNSASVSLAPVFVDPDGDVLSLSVESSNTNAVTVSLTGTTLTINENGLGVSTITVTASDGELSTAEQFTVTVNNVDDSPVLVNPISDKVVEEHFGSIAIDLTSVFSDPDVGDILSYTAISSNTAVVTVSVSEATLTVSEAGIGESVITVTATDDSNLSVTDQFTVTVNNVNDPPFVAVPLPDQIYDEYFGSKTIDLSGTFGDPDAGTVLTLTAVSSQPGVVTLSLSGTDLNISEVGLGTTTITVTANDGLLSVDEQFTVTVSNTNDRPEIVQPIADLSLNEYFGTYNIFLTEVFSDKDEDELVFSPQSSAPDVVTVAIEGNRLIISEVGFGTSLITVTASDGELSVEEQFSVTVSNVNDAPEVVESLDDIVTDEHFGTATVDLTGTFADKDGDELIITASSSDNGVVQVSIEEAILTITELGPGVDIITVTASDGFLSVEEQFSINVIDINDAPEIMVPIPDQNIVENIGSAELDLDVYFSDEDDESLVYSVVLRDTGIVSYALDQTLLLLTPVDTGSTMVTITASDPEGLMAADSFMVHVEEELLFIVRYGSSRIQNKDTIIFCNDAGQITIDVITNATWGFTNDFLWMAVAIEQDSTLSVAFSSNLTGDDRIGDVLLSDAQGHVIKFFVKQTEHCMSSVVPGDRRADLKMYPNPVEDRLFIETGEGLRRGMKIEVIDQQGRLLFVEEVKEDALGVPLEIDMHGYIAGPYYIRISDEKGSFTGKVVKQ